MILFIVKVEQYGVKQNKSLTGQAGISRNYGAQKIHGESIVG